MQITFKHRILALLGYTDTAGDNRERRYHLSFGLLIIIPAINRPSLLPQVSEASRLILAPKLSSNSILGML